jgi:hypothetical protein
MTGGSQSSSRAARHRCRRAFFTALRATLIRIWVAGQSLHDVRHGPPDKAVFEPSHDFDIARTV